MFKKVLPGEAGKGRSVQAPSITNVNNKGSKAQAPSQANQEKDQKNKAAIEKELSSEEKLALIEIKPIERKALEKAFRRLSKATVATGDESFSTPKGDEDREAPKKQAKGEENKVKDYFTAEDVAKLLVELKHTASKPEIDLMIWVISFSNYGN